MLFKKQLLFIALIVSSYNFAKAREFGSDDTDKLIVQKEVFIKNPQQKNRVQNLSNYLDSKECSFKVHENVFINEIELKSMRGTGYYDIAMKECKIKLFYVEGNENKTATCTTKSHECKNYFQGTPLQWYIKVSEPLPNPLF